MTERKRPTARLALLARAAIRRGDLVEARVRVSEAVAVDPATVTRRTWRMLIRAHRDADAVSLANLAMLCAQDPEGRAIPIAVEVVPPRTLLGAVRRLSPV
jgi:hypothetical protein